jgi:hypothetical protein
VPLEITLAVDDESVHLLDVIGFSVESDERIIDELSEILDSGSEASVVGRIAWNLYEGYPAISWLIIIRYLDGRSDGRLVYTAPGDVPEEIPVLELNPQPVNRISRYTRKPVI